MKPFSAVEAGLRSFCSDGANWAWDDQILITLNINDQILITSNINHTIITGTIIPHICHYFTQVKLFGE